MHCCICLSHVTYFFYFAFVSVLVHVLTFLEICLLSLKRAFKGQWMTGSSGSTVTKCLWRELLSQFLEVALKVGTPGQHQV